MVLQQLRSHIAPHKRITGHSLGHRVLCAVRLHMSFTMNAPAAAALELHWCYIMVVTGGYGVTTLWLHHGYLEAAALAAASARIEVKVVVLVRANKCVCSSYQLLAASSSLLAQALPTLGLTNSAGWTV